MLTNTVMQPLSSHRADLQHASFVTVSRQATSASTLASRPLCPTSHSAARNALSSATCIHRAAMWYASTPKAKWSLPAGLPVMVAMRSLAWVGNIRARDLGIVIGTIEPGSYYDIMEVSVEPVCV